MRKRVPIAVTIALIGLLILLTARQSASNSKQSTPAPAARANDQPAAPRKDAAPRTTPTTQRSKTMAAALELSRKIENDCGWEMPSECGERVCAATWNLPNDSLSGLKFLANWATRSPRTVASLAVGRAFGLAESPCDPSLRSLVTAPNLLSGNPVQTDTNTSAYCLVTGQTAGAPATFDASHGADITEGAKLCDSLLGNQQGASKISEKHSDVLLTIVNEALSPGTTINNDQLRQVQRPVTAVDGDFIGRATWSDLEGRTVAVQVPKGSTLNVKMLVPRG